MTANQEEHMKKKELTLILEVKLRVLNLLLANLKLMIQQLQQNQEMRLILEKLIMCLLDITIKQD